VIGEETGFIGIATLVGLFGLFGWAGMRAAHRARDRYSKLMAAGLTSLILGQAVVNLYAVLGLAPLTGVTLPFISYGGSSLVMTLASAGLILNVARTRGVATSRSTSSAPRKASRPAARGGSARAAKLRAVEGGGKREQSRRTASAKRRSSSGRNRGSRGSGARRRRRAAS
jgi:cell division protein FtsW